LNPAKFPKAKRRFDFVGWGVTHSRSFFAVLFFFGLIEPALSQSAQPIFDRLSKLRDVSISSPLDTQVLTYDVASGKWKNTTAGGGSGTVTSFSAGNLSPLFTTSVSNPTTTPALSFALSTAAAHAFLGNNTGSTAAPAYVQPAFTDLSGSATDAQVPDILTLTRISNLTTNGFVKTGSGNGTLSIDTSTYLTGNQTITITGDASGSGTTAITLALSNIPDLTTQAGSILATNIAAPTTPAAGKTKVYVDSTSKNIAAKNDAGTVNHGVQTRTATASNWISAVADDGSTTISQPAFTDVIGAIGFVAGGKTADTTINDTVTFTTGGVTYAAPAIASGQVYRVRALGTFVAVSSATSRSAQVACFWGSTQLTLNAQGVMVSSALTTSWELEFVLTGTSTTAIWTTGYFNGHINQLTSTAATAQISSVSGTTTVTAGAQTLDLRFNMTAAVATDQWVVKQVTMERLK
jgi:hypothetical protein